MVTADEVLKDVYQPAVREQLENAWVLLSQIEGNGSDIVGREAVFALHLGRNNAVGNRPRGGQLPRGGNQRYDNIRVGIERTYGAFRIDNDLIEASSNDQGAFLRVLDAEVNGAVTDVRNDVSRQIYGDETKAIFQCGATSSDTEIVLTNPLDSSLRWIENGMTVDIGTLANYTAVVAGALVVDVDRVAGTITIDSAVTTTTSHYVTRAGSEGSEIIGLREIVSDTVPLHGLDPANEPKWASLVNANGGTARAADDVLFQKMIEDIHQESGKTPNMIMTTYGVRRNFVSGLDSRVQYSNTLDIKGGFKAASVAAGNTELALVVDPDCPSGRAYFLNTDHLKHHKLGQLWKWRDRDGSMLYRLPDYDSWEAQLYGYHQLATDKRAAHGVIEDLIES